LDKACAEVLCRFEEVAALEVVTGNIDAGGPPKISVRKVQGGLVEKFHSPQGANSSAYTCVLFCFIKPILGNRYGPGVIP